MTTRAVGGVKLCGSLSLLQASLRRGRDGETQRQRTHRERDAVTSQGRQHVLHDHILSARELERTCHLERNKRPATDIRCHGPRVPEEEPAALIRPKIINL